MFKPRGTSTNHILPYGELSPTQFERLCLWLVEYEKWQDAEHYGEAGNEQGRDVIAYRIMSSGEQQLWYFQCKRYREIGAAELKKEVTKIAAHIAAGEIPSPVGIVFVTNAVVSAATRKEVKAACHTKSLACRFWAHTELDLKVKKHEAIVKEFFNLQFPISNPQFTPSLSRLPNMLTNDLFGREAEVQMLNDAWNKQQTNVIVFVAFGGSGKSALVNRWVHEVMARENWRGAERVYAWSFWSQGSDQPQTSADPFIDAALRWFGDADPTASSPWDKGERLARLIKQTRTLLILDGLEPLQHPKHTMEGRLKEQSMQALLKELAAGQPGLCVVSTREHIADLQGFRAPAVIAHDLEQLSPAAGASILRKQQIEDSDEELQQASNEFGNHALALTILASFLHNAYDGDVRKRKEIGPLTESLEHGGHARRVMTSYETWLRDAGEDTLVAVLRVLGLFNRPADAASLAALRAAPAIPDLTEALLPLSEPQWKDTLAKLGRLKLLTDSSTHDEVDAHPLLREHFRDQLQRAHPAAWQAGNLRLYEHLTRTAKEFPDTLEEMQPLYAAVLHGCAAGRQQQALDDVFLRRIRRGNEHFSVNKVGAWSVDLVALSGFFIKLWDTPSNALAKEDQAFVLSEAGSGLRALGRLQDALKPMQLALDLFIAQPNCNWKQAAKVADNLCDMCLTLGQLSQARTFAQKGIDWADRSGDGFQRMCERTSLANVLHQEGKFEEAASEFHAAEAVQKEWCPKVPFLYSVFGVRYCDLLLGNRHFQEVQARASKMLEMDAQYGDLLSMALDHLVLGQSYLGLAMQLEEGLTKTEYIKQAGNSLDQAVARMQQGVHYDDLPRCLLVRAAWARVTGDYDRAPRDLAEALALAERGEMRLHLCDHHLESARLHLAQGQPDEARIHWETARNMVDEMGYHRRDAEVAELEAQLTTLG